MLANLDNEFGRSFFLAEPPREVSREPMEEGI